MSRIPTPELVSTNLNVSSPQAQLSTGPLKSLAGDIPGAQSVNSLPPTGRVLTLDTEMGFTKANFRQGLVKTTGIDPGRAAQAHHVFPQRYQKIFMEKGINIHNPKYGAWWNTSDHLKNAWGYNRAWENFFRSAPTRTEILDHGRKLMQESNISINF